MAVAPEPGDLLISEILWDTPGDENQEEWFELYNASGHALKLQGVVIADEQWPGNLTEAFSFEQQYELATEGFLIFGRHLTNTPAGGDVDFVFDFALSNGGDTLVVALSETIIDRYQWQSGDGPDAGRSVARQWDQSCLSDTRSADPSCFCASDTQISGALYGTPGAKTGACTPLDACSGPEDCTEAPASYCDAEGRRVTHPSVGTCDESSRCVYAPNVTSCEDGFVCAQGACVEDTGSEGRAPVAGDLVITEVLYDLLNEEGGGDEGRWEYFEVYNRSGEALQLEGMYIGDEAGGVRIDTPLLIAAGAYALFTARSESNLNGGLTGHASFNQSGGHSLANGGDKVFVGTGPNYVSHAIATLNFDDGPLAGVTEAGEALQMAPTCYTGGEVSTAADCYCPATQAISETNQNRGSPGLANHECD